MLLTATNLFLGVEQCTPITIELGDNAFQRLQQFAVDDGRSLVEQVTMILERELAQVANAGRSQDGSASPTNEANLDPSTNYILKLEEYVKDLERQNDDLRNMLDKLKAEYLELHRKFDSAMNPPTLGSD